jgi:hypothetical protein
VRQQACPDAPPWEKPIANEGLGYPENPFKIKPLQQIWSFVSVQLLSFVINSLPMEGSFLRNEAARFS